MRLQHCRQPHVRFRGPPSLSPCNSVALYICAFLCASVLLYLCTSVLLCFCASFYTYLCISISLCRCASVLLCIHASVLSVPLCLLCTRLFSDRGCFASFCRSLLLTPVRTAPMRRNNTTLPMLDCLVVGWLGRDAY